MFALCLWVVVVYALRCDAAKFGVEITHEQDLSIRVWSIGEDVVDGLEETGFCVVVNGWNVYVKDVVACVVC